MLNVVSSRPARHLVLGWELQIMPSNFQKIPDFFEGTHTTFDLRIQYTLIVLYTPYLVNQLKGYTVSEFVSSVSQAGNKLLTSTKRWTTKCRYGDKSHVWGLMNARPAICQWSYILILWLGFLMSCCIPEHYAALISWHQYCQCSMTLGFLPITPL